MCGQCEQRSRSVEQRKNLCGMLTLKWPWLWSCRATINCSCIFRSSQSSRLASQEISAIVPFIWISLYRKKWMRDGWRLLNRTALRVNQMMKQRHTGVWLVWRRLLLTRLTFTYSAFQWFILTFIHLIKLRMCIVFLFHSLVEQIIWLTRQRCVIVSDTIHQKWLFKMLITLPQIHHTQ